MNCLPLQERLCATYGSPPSAVKAIVKSNSRLSRAGTRLMRARFFALASVHLTALSCICQVPATAASGSFKLARRLTALEFDLAGAGDGVGGGAGGMEATAGGVGGNEPDGTT